MKEKKEELQWAFQVSVPEARSWVNHASLCTFHTCEYNINPSVGQGQVLTTRGLKTSYIQLLLSRAGQLSEDQELCFDQNNLTAHLNIVTWETHKMHKLMF